MGTRIEYKSLYGNGNNDPVSSLLCVDGVNILLDCGWDDDHNLDMLQPIQEVLGEIDAILISHPDPAHLGALPYLVGRLKLEVPIYATVACHRMGQMFMYDQILSRQLASDFDLFTLDDVDAAFGLMRQLKFQQLTKLTGRAAGMSVTAFAAGHLIGGAIWQVLTSSEEQIVYAMHWNHSKDRFLKRADLVGRFSRPAVFITDACSALRHPVDNQKRNAAFLHEVTGVLQNNGSVLVPSDTVGRALELLLVLEHHWFKAQLKYTIVMLTTVAHSSMEFVKSQLEWMNSDISDQFLKSKVNPFELRRVKICNTREQVYELPKGPKIILASLPTLSAGLSRQLFVDWAPNPANLIVFTSDLPEGSVGHQVQRKAEGEEPLRIQMQYGRRVELQGEELKIWQEKQRAQLLESEPILTDQSIEDLEEELQGSSPAAETLPPRGSKVLGGRVSLGSQSVGLPPSELSKSKTKDTLVDGFTAPEGAGPPMFPDAEDDDREWTEYGLALKPGDFRRMREDREAAELESDEEAVEELPTKVVTSDVEVNVRARVMRFPFDGLTDQHSIKNLLTKVAPRQLIVAFGSPQARQVLFESCSREQDVGWLVHKAEVGQSIDVSAGSSSYTIALTDKLLEGLQFRNMANYRLAWLNSRVQNSTIEEAGQVLVPDATLKAHSQQGAIYIGDVKLSALRKALGEAKISAEFRSGMLLCQSHVIIKPGGNGGQLTLEGPISDDYYKIREILYAQYHVC